jgi:hypothetical protein
MTSPRASNAAKADRRQKRRLERLIRKDEKRGVGSIQDAAFFEQNPERNFRMRLATSGEIAATEIISNNGAPLPLPENALWWTVIKQVAPGLRMRMQVYAPLPPLPLKDIPEEAAREIFNLAISRETET